MTSTGTRRGTTSLKATVYRFTRCRLSGIVIVSYGCLVWSHKVQDKPYPIHFFYLAYHYVLYSMHFGHDIDFFSLLYHSSVSLFITSSYTPFLLCHHHMTQVNTIIFL